MLVCKYYKAKYWVRFHMVWQPIAAVAMPISVLDLKRFLSRLRIELPNLTKESPRNVFSK